MNPQYVPQQQFGASNTRFPPGIPGMSLGQMDGYPPQSMNQQGDMSFNQQMFPSNQFHPQDLGPPQGQMPPPQNQMPPQHNQMGPPPSQLPPPSQMGPPPSSMGNPHSASNVGAPPHLPVSAPSPTGPPAPGSQNQSTGSVAQLGAQMSQLMGTRTSQSGLPSGQMGLPSVQMGPPPSQMSPLPGQTGPQSGPMGPPSNQMPPPSGQMRPPTSQMPPTSTNQMGPSSGPQASPLAPPSKMPPMSNQMAAPMSNMGPMDLQSGPQPVKMGPPSNQMPPGHQKGQPSMGQPPMGQSPMPHPPISQPPMGLSQIGQPPAGQPSMGHPPMGQPPMSQPPMGQPQMGQPPMGQPPMGQPPMGQPPMGQPPMGQPPMGQPPMGQPPMGQPPMGQPPMGQPPMGQPPMGQPPMGQPPMSQPQMGQPPMGQPPMSQPQMGQPPMNQPPMGQPPMSQPPMGQPQMGQPPIPSQGNRMGGPPLGNQARPPQKIGPGGPRMPQPMGSQGPAMNQPGNFGASNIAPPNMGPPNMGPPSMGGPNMGPPIGQQNQFQQKPGQMQYPGAPSPMGQQGQFQDGNFPTNPNQMQGMQLGNQRQYPGGPMKPVVNGENLPHMPPPMNPNQGYVNGNRGPQQPMGYPPMPGQQQPMPGGPYPPQQQYQQPQQTRRLDPDQMPSPIQVTQDDQRTRSGIFCTNQKGLVPPLVSTNFITQDQGNAGPRFIRSTMYNVPTTADMMKQTAVPFGLVISPMARTLDQEYPPPIVDFGEMGPVRCIRCKAYMSPFMQFIDSGRRFQCLFCKATTEVPTEYFQHLDHTGQRVDRYDRPELILGTYEFVATTDYCRNNVLPKPPAIIFVIDVSYNNIKSGLVQLLCAEMKEVLKNLPIDQGHEKSKMKVGFITFNNTVHFYNIKGTLAQPQMMVVGDTMEMFMPLLDGFLCDFEDSEAVINSLMQQIPTMFVETRETETVLLPAIQAGLEALKASECAGKLIVFHSTLPTAEAPGRLKNRDDRKLLGTEKERTVLSPQTQAYNQLGQDCVAAGCSVDLFVVNNSYIDIATIGQICRLTGGEVFKYTYFQADLDGPRLISDIITDISRPIAFDSIMRVRTSTGVRPTDFYGHFFMSNTTDMEIAAMDCDKAVAVEIKHDDKLTEEDGVYIQVALLYTSCSGQRRLRVLNLSLKTCSQMADLYRSCELDTLVNFFAKQCVYRLLENNPKAVKDSLVNRCALILACYRKNCASPSSLGQLILPECMKLLPLYVNCLLKSDAISGGSDMTLDDRSFVMQAVTIMDIPTSVVYLYPRLIPLHDIQNGTDVPEIPSPVRCTVEKMMDNGVYLLENGIHMFLWVGLGTNSEWVQSVFGVPTAGQIDVDRVTLPKLDNPLSTSIRNLVSHIRKQRHRHMRLTLVRQRDKLEAVFRHFLVEDRGQDNTSSYVDFLCHMHKEIRQLLS